jgi:hypothetical protein
MLGATSMSSIKANLILGLGIDTIYVIPDNDQGGKVMWSTAKKYLKPTGINLLRYPLPSYEECGIKIDPGNMRRNLLREFVEYVEEENNFKRHGKLI